MEDGFYFVREKGSDKIYTAKKEGALFYRDTFKKETGNLEVVCPVPTQVLTAQCRGIKILNLARTMGLYRSR